MKYVCKKYARTELIARNKLAAHGCTKFYTVPVYHHHRHRMAVVGIDLWKLWTMAAVIYCPSGCNDYETIRIYEPKTLHNG